MATKKAAKKVAAKAAKAGTKLESKWGRVGSASELYKRLIMEEKLDNKACFARVAKELGQKAAGKATYAGWYRAHLKKLGVKGVPASK